MPLIRFTANLQDLTTYVQRHIQDITTYITCLEDMAVIERCFELLAPQDVRLLYNTITIISDKAATLNMSLDGTDESLAYSIRALQLQ